MSDENVGPWEAVFWTFVEAVVSRLPIKSKDYRIWRGTSGFEFRFRFRNPRYKAEDEKKREEAMKEAHDKIEDMARKMGGHVISSPEDLMRVLREQLSPDPEPEDNPFRPKNKNTVH